MSPSPDINSPWNKRSLRYLLENTNEFVSIVELVNSRGVITERGGSKVLHLARNLADLPGIHALSITDNPGGNAVLSAGTLGFDLDVRHMRSTLETGSLEIEDRVQGMRLGIQTSL